jgi:3-hydroxy-9,10-secoandrosta-1,3,5(10)-triene-9,17-dione monooxygenase reductase component
VAPSSPLAGAEGAIEPVRFRRVFGHFATGVTVVTCMDDDGPAGFTCQAFAALSLDPPLVLFCPGKASATWPRIAAAGMFCVNVLASEHREIARVFGNSGAGKFASVGSTAAANGAPVLDGALTWAGCTLQAVHDAGDHFVAVGLVTELGPVRTGEPLLFYRGRFGVPGPAEGPPEVVDTLLSWSRHADWI